MDSHEGAVVAQFERVEVDATNERGATVQGQELDRTPDADGRQTWTPVPAKTKLCLAHGGAFRIAAPCAQCFAFDALQWRVYPDRQCVWGVTQGNIEPGGPEHVVMLADFGCIQVHRGERIQPLEEEAIVPGGYVQLQAIPPLALLHPRAVLLIVGVERVWDAPRVDQRAMDVTRNGDW